MAKRRSKLNFDTYWKRAADPFQSLIFLLPLLIIYEIGVRAAASDENGVVHIYARTLLSDFFEHFGNTTYYLPSFCVVMVLLCLQLFKKDAVWSIDPILYGYMWIESTVMAGPLFIMLTLISRLSLPRTMESANLVGDESVLARIALALGAGIYEELLFRLIVITLMHLVLVNLMALKEEVGMAWAVATSAVAFAIYHFHPGNEFAIGSFLQYTAAGIYFAVLFRYRGFGICVGVHSIYDLLVTVGLPWLSMLVGRNNG